MSNVIVLDGKSSNECGIKMDRSHTTEDGHTLIVNATGYMDWGLTITKGDKELFYSPHALNNESYGFKANPAKFDDYEEACDAQADGDQEAIVEWNEEEWQECLKNEADVFIEAYVVQKEGRCRHSYPYGGE